MPSVRPSNIILGGVGQGGATTLHTLFSLGLKWGGFIGIST